MAHKLMRLKQSLLNTPLLADKATVDSVFSYLNDRNAGLVSAEQLKAESELRKQEYDNLRFSYNEDVQTAVMYIEGPLSYKPVTFWGMDCGGANYTHLKEDVETAISLGAKTILWNMDSGGGEAHGMADSARYIRSLIDANDVHLVAYVDGMSASACYGLASVADEIIASKDSDLGSIGVVVQLVNDSKALEKHGYERTFLYKGDDKVALDEEGKWRDGFIEELNNKIDYCYQDFVSLVAENRGLPEQAVIDTQAKTFNAEEAVSLGLCDNVMSPEEFYTYLADVSQARLDNNTNINRTFRFNKSGEKMTKKMKAEMEQALLASQESLSEAVAALALQEEVVTTLEATVATLEAQAAEMVANMEELKAELKTLEDVKASLEAEAETNKLKAREEKLAAVVAADKVEGLMASMSTLDDTAFNAVVDGFKAQSEALEQSEMFQELGSDAEVQNEDPVDIASQLTLAAMKARL